MAFERREPGPHDIVMTITHCGICHSDLHAIDDDLGNSCFPVVPGHEIVGVVTAIGDEVDRFQVGDKAAIGCYIDSCRSCGPCLSDRQQMCIAMIPSFNGTEKDGDHRTWGGFSTNYVADQDYVLKIPQTMDSAQAAPILCAGITVWSPLQKWRVGPGSKVGIVGLGGLGHMAVKLAVALGADVTVFTTSEAKVVDAMRLGAHNAILSNDGVAMAVAAGTLDFILDTVSAQHDIDGYIEALRPEGTLCLLGIGPGGLQIANLSVVFGQKCIAGSLIGGLDQTQAVIDFCAAHDVMPEIELVPLAQINQALDRLRRNDVKYRFVVEMTTGN
ncbi:putative zinc-type alcohol dehydrogenase-like protein [Sphingobium vermicomposti]|uniref:Putative zinc-type alcohol dehydrogenase-like protein n=2 Tax=Sphingobium vermicomposti TaxID=529005 RepID=A0A846M677_9SPHN|nr:NAD(P)-dependent alcohol dehydrogenase [Sphingobium vermicomposti]NIJ17767.1 putative zinc-type alcohol dehydrogenase-like protein [Sphingobium vermicomposti]